MIAAENVALRRAAFAERRSPELATKHDQGVIQQSALAQILEQRGDGPIHRRAFLCQPVTNVFSGIGAVEVPAPVEELHVTHALFDQPTGEQAVVRETRFSRLRAVSLDGPGGFPRDVHHLRHRQLHPVGELVLRDARLRFGMAQLAGLDFIQVAQRVEAHAADLAIHPGGIRSVEHRVSFRAALDALIHGRQEAAAEGIFAAIRLHAAGDQDDEPGQILVLRAQPVCHPRADGRTPGARGAGVNEQLGGRVIELICRHRTDHAKVVGHGVKVRNRVGHPHAALAVLREGATGAEQLGRAGGECETFAFEEGVRAILSVALHQLGLVVEQVEMWR